MPMSKISNFLIVLGCLFALVACGPSKEDMRQAAIDDLTFLEAYVDLMDDFTESVGMEYNVVDDDGIQMVAYGFFNQGEDLYGWGTSARDERIYEDIDSLSSMVHPDTIRLFYGKNMKGAPILAYTKSVYMEDEQGYMTSVATLNISRLKYRKLAQDTTDSSIYDDVPYSFYEFELVNRTMFKGKYNFNAFKTYEKMVEDYSGISSRVK